MKKTALFCDPCSSRHDDVKAIDHIELRSLAHGRFELDPCVAHDKRFWRAMRAFGLRPLNGVSSPRAGVAAPTGGRRAMMVARAEKLVKIVHDHAGHEGMTLKQIATRFGESPADTARVFRNAVKLKLPIERRGWTTGARYHITKKAS